MASHDGAHVRRCASEGCSTQLSHYQNDMHLLCVECRGQDCLSVKCDVCKEWSDQVYDEWKKHFLRRKRTRDQRKQGKRISECEDPSEASPTKAGRNKKQCKSKFDTHEASADHVEDSSVQALDSRLDPSIETSLLTQTSNTLRSLSQDSGLPYTLESTTNPQLQFESTNPTQNVIIQSLTNRILELERTVRDRNETGERDRRNVPQPARSCPPSRGNSQASGLFDRVETRVPLSSALEEGPLPSSATCSLDLDPAVAGRTPEEHVTRHCHFLSQAQAEKEARVFRPSYAGQGNFSSHSTSSCMYTAQRGSSGLFQSSYDLSLNPQQALHNPLAGTTRSPAPTDSEELVNWEAYVNAHYPQDVSAVAHSPATSSSTSSGEPEETIHVDSHDEPLQSSSSADPRSSDFATFKEILQTSFPEQFPRGPPPQALNAIAEWKQGPSPPSSEPKFLPWSRGMMTTFSNFVKRNEALVESGKPKPNIDSTFISSRRRSYYQASLIPTLETSPPCADILRVAPPGKRPLAESAKSFISPKEIQHSLASIHKSIEVTSLADWVFTTCFFSISKLIPRLPHADRAELFKILSCLSVGSNAMSDLGGELTAHYGDLIVKRRDTVLSFLDKLLTDKAKASLLHSPISLESLFDPSEVNRILQSITDRSQYDALYKPRPMSFTQTSFQPRRQRLPAIAAPPPTRTPPQSPTTGRKPFHKNKSQKGRQGKPRQGPSKK